MGNVFDIPGSTLIAETNFSVTIAEQFLDLPVMDTIDWRGAMQADYSPNRKYGFPFVDYGVRALTGTFAVNLVGLVPTVVPVNNVAPVFLPPLAPNDNIDVQAVGLLAYEAKSIRLSSRFYKLQIENNGAVDPCTGYIVAFLRSA